jgi:hypothetical protein
VCISFVYFGKVISVGGIPTGLRVSDTNADDRLAIIPLAIIDTKFTNHMVAEMLAENRLW